MGAVYDRNEVRLCAIANYSEQNDPSRGVNQVSTAVSRLTNSADSVSANTLTIREGTLTDVLRTLGGGNDAVVGMRDCIDLHARQSSPTQLALQTPKSTVQ
ncbi:MAG: hypothetical protein AAFQ82_00865 [Myxococcota bacterium]